MGITQPSNACPAVTPARLADLMEQHGAAALEMVIRVLRDAERAPQSPAPALGEVAQSAAPPAHVSWQQAGVIENFDHVWPEVHEHYPSMPIYEGRDDHGLVRFAVSEPKERMSVYGRERGWVSVWEVVNGQPREQRAVFVETNDFATTGDRMALIAGKDGRGKALFEPHERHLLPAVYDGFRVEVHRDRCTGPYAKNRLGVVATDDEVEVMLEHALVNLRLRS